ncbi:MAG: M23 family metallopeptidase [bacterium]|nr:M23 family metallopeptidase [bacterium]
MQGLEDGIRQGDLAFVTVKNSSKLDYLTGKLEGEKLLFQRDSESSYSTLIGIPMDKKPGEYKLFLKGEGVNDSIIRTVRFEIKKRDFNIERLSLPQKMVEPGEELLKRIRRDNVAIFKAKQIASKERFWRGEFIKPVKGKIANNFGARRILNGVDKKPHSGNDIKAGKGSEIKSPNDGRITYLDDTYYGGNTVIIDHGQGLSTLYMHLSKILVNHGDSVKKGETIGLVGSTGRSTGPHLHWGAYFDGFKVDPASLLVLDIDSPNSYGGIASNKKGYEDSDRLGGNE